MSDDILGSLRHLSDGELVARVKSLAGREHDATAFLVAHLAELDTRDVHLRAGYGSLFAYCRDALALSEHEAYHRIEAARAARRFPVILEMLAAGSVNLTTVRLLVSHLTVANHRDVLESVRGKGKSEVEEVVARLSPRPDVPPSLRKLKAPLPAAGPIEAQAPLASVPAVIPVSTVRVVTVAVPGYPGQAVAPLSPDRYRLQLTIGLETLEKLRLARDLLRHAIPSGDEAAILDRALTALLADLARKKFAVAGAPRPSRGTAPGSRHVPAEVKRAVFLRDLGRCAFVGTGGRRCAERGFLEFHHVRPHAMGGEATVDNVQLRCRRHNACDARADFGREAAARSLSARTAGPVGDRRSGWSG
ncbi:MAG TPA: HNH endonuclease signature motif containing protein [Vicinamibacteria bacterium]|nr:HNH endonuclease signature motif containing protein [Vicinamibacteria bacterium]